MPAPFISFPDADFPLGSAAPHSDSSSGFTQHKSVETPLTSPTTGDPKTQHSARPSLGRVREQRRHYTRKKETEEAVHELRHEFEATMSGLREDLQEQVAALRRDFCGFIAYGKGLEQQLDSMETTVSQCRATSAETMVEAMSMAGIAKQEDLTKLHDSILEQNGCFSKLYPVLEALKSRVQHIEAELPIRPVRKVRPTHSTSSTSVPKVSTADSVSLLSRNAGIPQGGIKCDDCGIWLNGDAWYHFLREDGRVEKKNAKEMMKDPPNIERGEAFLCCEDCVAAYRGKYKSIFGFRFNNYTY